MFQIVFVVLLLGSFLATGLEIRRLEKRNRNQAELLARAAYQRAVYAQALLGIKDCESLPVAVAIAELALHTK